MTPYQDMLINGANMADVQRKVAESDTTYHVYADCLSTSLGRGLDQDDTIMIHALQAGLGDQNYMDQHDISGQRAYALMLSDGFSKSYNIVKNWLFGKDISEPEGQKYTVIHTLPTTAYIEQDSSGHQFYGDKRATPHDVAIMGQSHSNDQHADKVALLYHYMKQGGDFDIQRDTNTHLFYPDLTYGANYNIGVLAASLGLYEEEMDLVGKAYAFINSDNHKEIINNTVRVWDQGYKDTINGYVQWRRK